MRTLIIEDEPQLARHIRGALVRHGHSAEVRHDGAAGLQAALDSPPDLIVLDVNLPTVDGFEVMARIRASNSTTRIIMLTARAEVEDRIRGLKGGADDYLAKPFNTARVRDRLIRIDSRLSPRLPRSVKTWITLSHVYSTASRAGVAAAEKESTHCTKRR